MKTYTPYGETESLPSNWFARIQEILEQENEAIWLDSAKDGRWSILACQPEAIIESKNGVISHRVNTNGGFIEHSSDGAIFQYLSEALNRHNATIPEGYPPFCGGVLGVFAYPTVTEYEPIKLNSPNDLHTPDVYTFLTKELLVVDHLANEIWFIVEAGADQERRMNLLRNRWNHLSQIPEKTERDTNDFLNDLQYDEHTAHVQFAFKEQQFTEAVEVIQSYIASGDTFQVNLSVRQERPLSVTGLDVYRHLRTLNPSPYMAFIKARSFTLVCGSPELLVEKNNNEAITKPIAGTRSRGKTSEETAALAEELRTNEKERAEHVMLVDLERNDLGKVCEYGSVHADHFMSIEEYSHVIHLVSQVSGRLSDQADPMHLFQAVFPGGTITGAPKHRTMEIIDELEPHSRGFYTGSVGWIGYDGNMVMNIIIRSMLVQQECAYVQSGAGIVYDSVARWEFKEALKKSAAVWQAVSHAEAEQRIKHEKRRDEHDLND
ncbi:anthranilate synthase component I family protein [Bacillaceae bacterium SIJ1]|uniref:anthranilate synthase component I family protein n=1 Tax=Litoribacterium kuwaitense TaxID=1398745 RepID=UPI0013ED5735|nr:anthranilate synthase component I family protein [Litoribacterium kuwaitense]NGP45818.1 anthranilate synthase component I family protein [Litoribacterium kuwaitense]